MPLVILTIPKPVLVRPQIHEVISEITALGDIIFDSDQADQSLKFVLRK